MDRKSPQETLAAPPAPATNWAALGARAAVGAVFLLSGAQKVAAPVEEFAVVIEAYHIVAPDSALTMARFLPWIELILGASLLLGYAARQAALGSAVLLGVFIAAILSTFPRGLELANCGCFGAGVHLSPWQAVTLDAVLLGLAVLAQRRGAGPWSLDAWIEDPSASGTGKGV